MGTMDLGLYNTDITIGLQTYLAADSGYSTCFYLIVMEYFSFYCCLIIAFVILSAKSSLALKV